MLLAITYGLRDNQYRQANVKKNQSSIIPQPDHHNYHILLSFIYLKQRSKSRLGAWCPPRRPPRTPNPRLCIFLGFIFCKFQYVFWIYIFFLKRVRLGRLGARHPVAARLAPSTFYILDDAWDNLLWCKSMVTKYNNFQLRGRVFFNKLYYQSYMVIQLCAIRKSFKVE